MHEEHPKVRLAQKRAKLVECQLSQMSVYAGVCVHSGIFKRACRLESFAGPLGYGFFLGVAFHGVPCVKFNGDGLMKACGHIKAGFATLLRTRSLKLQDWCIHVVASRQQKTDIIAMCRYSTWPVRV
eukprot:5319510-Amphidinium_carterae.4